jgi:hypothetical protein
MKKNQGQQKINIAPLKNEKEEKKPNFVSPNVNNTSSNSNNVPQIENQNVKT